MEDISSGNTTLDDVEATLYRKILGTIIFVIIWPLIVLDMKWFPLGRPAAALLGATLMVIFLVVPQNHVFHVIAKHGNLQTVFLLVGMMLLSYYYDREGLLKVVALWIFGNRKPFSRILWKVCILSAVLSAIITNDATCLVLTPLLLNEYVKQERSIKELPPLLLGIATSANIGSASTFFGNPQNAYIAANADISLVVFFTASLPAALLGLLLSSGLLYLFYFRTACNRYPAADVEQVSASSSLQADNMHTNYQSITQHKVLTSLSASRRELALSYDQSCNPYLSSQIAFERSKLYNSNSRVVTSRLDSYTQKSPSSQETNLASRSLPADLKDSLIDRENTDTKIGESWKTARQFQVRELSPYMDDDIMANSELETSFSNTQLAIGNHPSGNGQHHFMEAPPSDGSERSRGWRERHERILTKLFIAWLVFITVVMVTLLAIPPLPSVKFNLGLVPMAAAILTMLVDTVIRGKYAYDAIMKVDWTVILLFGGLFVWLQGFQNTGFTVAIFKKIKSAMDLSKIHGVLVFTVFVVIASNVLSNVPLVVLLVQELENFLCSDSQSELCSPQLSGLLLAWVSTIAGNFTLIGSVANLIVAEKARNTIGFKLTFWEYLKFGFVSTLMVLFSGLPIVYFTSKNIHI